MSAQSNPESKSDYNTVKDVRPSDNYANNADINTICFQKKASSVNDYFAKHIRFLIKKHNKLLKNLSIEDCKEKSLLSEEEKQKAVDLRSEWIDIISSLSNDKARIFAIFTLYRNSGLSTISENSFDHISTHVINKYILTHNPSDVDRNSIVELLEHILIISRIIRHYNEAFSYGMISFMNGESATNLLQRDKNYNVYRISYTKFGMLVRTFSHNNFYKHKYLEEENYSCLKTEITETYNLTIQKDPLKIDLINKDNIIALINSKGEYYNSYGNDITTKDVNYAIKTHDQLVVENDGKYL